MNAYAHEDIRIDTPKGEVGGMWLWPSGARSAVVLAHGAGGDMRVPLLGGFCESLAAATLGTMRFNFPYAEQGRKGPNPTAALIDAWRAAFEAARSRAGGKPVFAGGKSLGGRMASLAVGDGMPAHGLVFIGYPLHPPGKPEQLRDAHLDGIRVPMLFLQGTQDPFARFDLIQAVTRRLGRWAVLHPVHGGDHSFRVKGEKRDDAETGRLLGSVAARFLQSALI